MGTLNVYSNCPVEMVLLQSSIRQNWCVNFSELCQSKGLGIDQSRKLYRDLAEEMVTDGTVYFQV